MDGVLGHGTGFGPTHVGLYTQLCLGQLKSQLLTRANNLNVLKQFLFCKTRLIISIPSKNTVEFTCNVLMFKDNAISTGLVCRKKCTPLHSRNGRWLSNYRAQCMIQYNGVIPVLVCAVG